MSHFCSAGTWWVGLKIDSIDNWQFSYTNCHRLKQMVTFPNGIFPLQYHPHPLSRCAWRMVQSTCWQPADSRLKLKSGKIWISPFQIRAWWWRCWCRNIWWLNMISTQLLENISWKWSFRPNKPENQDEDALGKIEQQQDFVILELGASIKVGVHL